MGKYNKSSDKNIFRHKEDLTWSEIDVEKNGKTTRLVIPDGKIGYGDAESQAQMAGDLATKHSDDTKAGDKAVCNLLKGPWDRSVWPILLDQADNFALESGLLDESKRAGLLSTVLELINEEMSSHLCMLGNSLIILPRSLEVPFDVDEITSKLESLELGVKITHLQ